VGQTDTDPKRWRVLALLSLAELLGMSLWFSASAIGPELQSQWGLSAFQVGWLTTNVQIGFVVGTAMAAILNLADTLSSRFYFSTSAVLAAGANALLLVAPGYSGALLSRFLTGLFLAGVYPPAMKMISTWFSSARGLAIGTVVGALIVGKATPYLLKAIPNLSMEMVIMGGSAAAVLGGLLVLFRYKDGPFPFSRAPFSWGLVSRVVAHRETRLAIGGYLGHMWELYAMWALVSIYFFELFRDRSGSIETASMLSTLTAFAVIAVGGVGTVAAGKWADRVGRERVAILSMVVSGGCALTIGWLSGPIWMVVGLGLIWGVSVVADSPLFSAVLTEVAPSHAVGTALTMQTSLGFALTGVSIQLTIWLSEAVGWGPAFSVLALGPLFGIISMARLKRLRRHRPERAL